MQINPHYEIIELILSDNNSTDNTNDIIKECLSNFKNLSYIHNTNKRNLGYYGNFKKCYELSNGKFLWILSDNEMPNIGLIDNIIKILKNHWNLFTIHLNEIIEYSNQIEKPNYINQVVDKEMLFKIAGYKLTLISTVIFKNKKKLDKKIFNEFKNNTFLAFLLFLQSYEQNNNAVIITGNSLISLKANISFNVFNSFTKDLSSVINFFTSQQNQILSIESEHNLMNSIIKNITYYHLLIYKAFGKIYNKKFENIKIIENNYKIYFNKYSEFNVYLNPIIKSSRIKLYFKFYYDKIIKKLF